MIEPTKHEHPDQTVISVAALVLDHLRESRVATYQEVLSLATTRVAGGEYLLSASLCFLYLLGLVRYRPTGDLLEFVSLRSRS